MVRGPITAQGVDVAVRRGARQRRLRSYAVDATEKRQPGFILFNARNSSSFLSQKVNPLYWLVTLNIFHLPN